MPPTNTELSSMVAPPLRTRTRSSCSLRCWWYAWSSSGPGVSEGIASTASSATCEDPIRARTPFMREKELAFIRIKSENIEPYDRQDGTPVRSVEVVKGLLLQPKRDPQRICYGNFTNAVLHGPLQPFSI